MARQVETGWLTVAAAALALSAMAHGTTYFVNQQAGGGDGSSWADAFTTLQEALNYPSLAAGDQIWVAAGTYYPDEDAPGDRKATFEMKPGVEIYGHFEGVDETNPDQRDLENSDYETILKGDLNNDDGPDFANRDDNSQHVLTYEYSSPAVDQATLLDGFTITGGYARHLPGDLDEGEDECDPIINKYHAWGGGVLLRRGDFAPPIEIYGELGPEFRNCKFVGNKARLVGGAIGALQMGVMLKWCTFEENLAENFCDVGLPNEGGGAVSTTGETAIVGCRFIDNESGGPGGAVEASARGLDENQGPWVKLANCEFRGNTASGWGGASYADSNNGYVVNCLFFDNESKNSSGGGTHAGLDLLNCTFIENEANGAEASGGGAFTWEGDGTARSCIFRGNSANNDDLAWFVQQADNICCPEHSNIEGFADSPETGCASDPSCTGQACQGDTCQGNINVETEFVDPENGDFHLLRLCSLEVDGGYDPDMLYPADEFDVNGDYNTTELTPDIDWQARRLSVPGQTQPKRDMGYDELHYAESAAHNPDCPCDCEEEPDGYVDVKDFLALLAQWGDTCTGTGHCDVLSPPGVGVPEFLLLLANWGTCGRGEPGELPQSVEDCLARFPDNMELLHMCLCLVEPCGEGCPPENCK